MFVIVVPVEHNRNEIIINKYKLWYKLRHIQTLTVPGLNPASFWPDIRVDKISKKAERLVFIWGICRKAFLFVINSCYVRTFTSCDNFALFTGGEPEEKTNSITWHLVLTLDFYESILIKTLWQVLTLLGYPTFNLIPKTDFCRVHNNI